MKKRQGRVSEKQHEIFLDFMSARPDFVIGKLNAHFTKTTSENLWKELTQKLNSNEVGPTKDIEKWKKTWTDWKCLVKAKAARIQRCSTVNNNAVKEVLSPLEVRLLSVVEWLNPTPLDTESSLTADENTHYQGEISQNDQELILKSATEEYVVLENNDEDFDEPSHLPSPSGTTEKPQEDACQALLYSTSKPLAIGPSFSLKRIKRSTFSNQDAKSRRTKITSDIEDDDENINDSENYQREKISALDGIKNALHRLADAEEGKAATFRDLVIAEQAKATALQNLVSMAFNYLNRQK